MRHSRFLLTFSSTAVVLATAPAWAETEAAKAGLPQMDTTFYPSQIFWLVITFGILYLLMARLALPSVARVQAKRREMIEKELAAAQAANEAAKKTVAEYEKILADARTQAVQAEDTTGAAKESMARVAEQQVTLKKSMQDAEARIASVRDAAMREAEASAADIAASIIDKITGLKLQVK